MFIRFLRGVEQNKPALTNKNMPDNRDEITTPDMVEMHRHIKSFANKFPEIDS